MSYVGSCSAADAQPIVEDLNLRAFELLVVTNAVWNNKLKDEREHIHTEYTVYIIYRVVREGVCNSKSISECTPFLALGLF